jgi:hypothetical protein
MMIGMGMPMSHSKMPFIVLLLLIVLPDRRGCNGSAAWPVPEIATI